MTQITGTDIKDPLQKISAVINQLEAANKQRLSDALITSFPTLKDMIDKFGPPNKIVVHPRHHDLAKASMKSFDIEVCANSWMDPNKVLFMWPEPGMIDLTCLND